MTALLTLLAVLVALFGYLYAWCLEQVGQIFGGGNDPIGDVMLAWWLAIAWIRGWLGGEIDSHNCREDVR